MHISDIRPPYGLATAYSFTGIVACIPSWLVWQRLRNDAVRACKGSTCTHLSLSDRRQRICPCSGSRRPTPDSPRPKCPNKQPTPNPTSEEHSFASCYETPFSSLKFTRDDMLVITAGPGVRQDFQERIKEYSRRLPVQNARSPGVLGRRP